MILTLKQSFSSAHLYNQLLWTPEENLKHFGRCYTEHGHGHNYTLEVGFKTSTTDLQVKHEEYQTLLKNLCNRLDHEHLNFVIPEFKTQIPTTENIALYFLNKLKETLSEKDLSHIRLYEMDDLWTEIRL
ncbi:6-carboxytetrahydropterin synthase [Bdellovibrio svalbardensis]|uniref:6-carboxy-5,6,7,8-tetrahydropterin synthase n=1 Tax=Bdellovibrio svalbardensis TaxID=2972972 RepID=A0ABT6DIP0_9BACT|nr:6-carboxytetrahydropterin synthase [Bdellovibrio svalbardensis]MDG0816636.1 6-carboxytetrahydropterin synthase [Bdellovibrio svalbardensis]